MHDDVILVTNIPRETAKLQGNPVEVLQIDGLGPLVVYHISDRLTFFDQLHPLGLQRRHRAGLKCKVIERSWDAQSFVDAGVVIRWYRVHILGLHERDKLVPSHLNEHVADASPQ